MDAVDEAKKLMSELTSDDPDPLINSGGAGDGEFTFSIDSDDEDDGKVEVSLEEKPKGSKANTAKLTESHPLDHPLREAPSEAGSAPNVGTFQAGYPPRAPQATNEQQQQQYPLSLAPPPLANDSAPSSTTPTSGTSSTFLSGVVGSGDAWKQQTSRFASAMANMAQRAAHQVATVTQQPPNSGPSMHSYGSSTTVVAGTMGGPQAMMMSGPNPSGTAMAFPGSGANNNNPAAATAMQSTTLDNEQKAALIKNHVGNLLPGERVTMFVANLMHVSDSTGFSYTYAQQQQQPDSDTIWCCAMTYYRLILFGTRQFIPPNRPAEWNVACWPSRPVHLLQMPLASMERVEKSVFSASVSGTGAGFGINGANGANNTISTTSLMGLQIVGKDNGRTLRFTTPSYADTVRAHEVLQNYAFPGRRNLGYLFAFESKKDFVMKSLVTDANGNKQVTLEPCRQRFHPLTEFARQFRKWENQSCPWAIYQTINNSYQLCGSYPSVLAGPASLEDTKSDGIRILKESAAFRSEQRLPMLSFAAGNGGGSIWRSSQPKIGLQGNRNSADELLLSHILDQAAKANTMNQQSQQLVPREVLLQLTGCANQEQLQSNWMPQTTISGAGELKILDLRPRSSAMANRTGGYGYENTSNYPGTTLQFCNIGNIHAVRDAYQKMSTLCVGVSTNDLQWNSLVEDTKWLSFTRLILAASWETAYWVHIFRCPVLLHCSHGWDRTSQVACLAQLMLDPYYRTMEGFACLVEKDFMAFGHPFHTRCAHGVGGSGNSGANSNNASADVDEGQISPVFIQFLDCVYQLVALYPEAFEINTRYLLDLSDHVYSCRFGNFLCDTERERETVAGIRQRTNSVWDFLEARHGGDAESTQNVAQSGVLLMPLPTLLRNVTLWTDRHARYGPKSTQRWLPSLLPTVKIPPDAGRHDDDAPEFYRVPTLQESQAQLLNSMSLPSRMAPRSNDVPEGTEEASQST